MSKFAETYRNYMESESECIHCGTVVRPSAWFCHEHYLLKEASYGIHDLERHSAEFSESGLRRVREYITFMNQKDANA